MTELDDEAMKLHIKNSKRGFDICYVCMNDQYHEKNHVGDSIGSEEKAWQIVNALYRNAPGYFSMIYVVYYSDINSIKSPVPGYREKALTHGGFFE